MVHLRAGAPDPGLLLAQGTGMVTNMNPRTWFHKSVLGRKRWEEEMAKHEYDEGKDALIRELDYVAIGERQFACIGIWSYNGGEAKLGIQRKISTRQGTITKAIGRMTRSEANIIFKVIAEALADDSVWTPGAVKV
jgi:hypothetical protein